MGDSQCTMGAGHWLCLLVICILAFIIPAHTHGAAGQAAKMSIEAFWDLHTTVDELKAFSKAEKKVNDGIHHSLAINAETVSRLEETMKVLMDKSTSSVEGIQDLRTSVDKLETFGKAEKQMYDGIHHSLAVKTDKISELEETVQVLKDKATVSVEAFQELHTTVEQLKAFSKAEKEVNDRIHQSLADIKDTISRLEETMQVLKDKATTSVEGITELPTTVDQLEAFSTTEKEVNNGTHHSLAANTETISKLEETLQVWTDEVKQFKQKETAPLEAENAHFVAIFDKTLVNPGPIKFLPSSFTAFRSKDGDQRELSANCGSNKWKEDPSTGRCYYIVSETTSWSGANNMCQMEGGQLASIGSPEEQNFINGMMKGISYNYYWTGGRRIQGQPPSSDATGWKWSDGSPFKFTNWDYNEPNNAHGHEECLEIHSLSGQWNDVDCSLSWNLRRIFCEKQGIIADGVFTAPISGVYELGFTAWTTANRSIVDIIHNNNRIIASASSNPVGKFGTNVIEELKAGDKVAVNLSQGGIGRQSEMWSAKLFGKLIEHS